MGISDPTQVGSLGSAQASAVSKVPFPSCPCLYLLLVFFSFDFDFCHFDWDEINYQNSLNCISLIAKYFAHYNIY